MYLKRPIIIIIIIYVPPYHDGLSSPLLSVYVEPIRFTCKAESIKKNYKWRMA